VLPGIIGSIQALETIKWILGAGDSLIGRLLIFDALKLRFRQLRLRKDPACPLCGERPSIHELIDYEAFCGIGVEPEYEGPEITAEELRREMDENGSGLVLIDVREPHEWDIAHIPQGPQDRACMGVPDEWVIYKGVVDRGNQDAAWAMMKWQSEEVAEQVRAHLRAFFQHDDGKFWIELLQPDRCREPRRPCADDHHIEFHAFAFDFAHPFRFAEESLLQIWLDRVLPNASDLSAR
jgi:rhodanese-related sulfurtransferase